MRRFVDWIAGVFGAIVAYRLWKRWRQPAPATTPATAPPADEPDDRAEELRAKLAETRANDDPAPSEPAETQASVEDRRHQVHEEGRAAIDRMNDQ